MKKSSKERGFVILIVLAVIATASVVLATQLASVQGQQGAKLRVNEEVKARDFAELCLEMADSYAVAVGNANVDFDTLLDPDGAIDHSGAGDDFLPPAGLFSGSSASVSIPPNATGSHYRYRAFNIPSPGTGGVGGTCFIRYDDNSDDSNSLLSAKTTSNSPAGTPVPEGTSAPNNGTDIPERDRDRTIITTVIAVVPSRTDQSTAYSDAHARVTVKRVRAMPIGASLGAAIEAGHKVDIDGDICGAVGGVTADIITGGACICGVTDAGGTSPSDFIQGPCASCPTCASSTGTTSTSGARPDPSFQLPSYDKLLKNEAFGKVQADDTNSDGAGPDAPVVLTGNNIADPAYGAGVIYVRNGSKISAGSTLAAKVNTRSDVYVWDPYDTDTNATLGLVVGTTITGAGSATKSCTNTSALDPLPTPCGWDPGGTPKLTCAATESQCWKLIARLGDGAPAAINLTGASVTEHADAAGTGFLPKAGDLPNVKLPAGAGSAEWRDIAPGSCGTCTAGTALVTQATNNYAFSGASLDNYPHLVVVIESGSNTSTTTVTGGATTGSNKYSIFTDNIIDENANHCCATCTCTATCSATTCVTAGTTTTCSQTKAANAPGYAVRTDKACTVAGDVLGTILCGNFDTKNNGCVVGGIMTTDKPGPINCDGTGSAFCEHASFCTKNNYSIFGDLQSDGNICFKNNPTMHSGIIETAGGSIGFKNNLAGVGQLRALNDIVGGQNTTLNFNGVAGSQENQGVASAMWMDAAW